MTAILTSFSARLQQVAHHPHIFNQFGRGVERETLRYQANNQLALTPHSSKLGAALTHKWITTDFSESLLEFITPVSQDVDTLLDQLKDVHHFTMSRIENEKLWPFSMPCFVDSEDSIPLANYGQSNIGKMKHLYRQGLKHRYGSLMQIISGVHFNFSFPDSYWDALYGQQSPQARAETQSRDYFGLIRNYYRYGWIIPYLFGASPALCGSFIKGRETGLAFESIGQTLYLPYATSLRLSDLGYTNSAQSDLNIGFNSLEEYLKGLNEAINKPSVQFAQLGTKENGIYKQLNTNVLQIENELYAPIRPKRVTKKDEKPSEALKRGGVEYIEVRSLDVNPFSAVGISKQQVLFLDLFVTWCALNESEPMKPGDLACWRSNWNRVILEGRKPGLEFNLCCDQQPNTLQAWGEILFDQLTQLACEMDKAKGDDQYQQVCHELRTWIQQPELTLSARLLDVIKREGGIGKAGDRLGCQYRDELLHHTYAFYTPSIMEQEVLRSHQAQQDIEQSDTQNFDDFLAEYFSYLK